VCQTLRNWSRCFRSCELYSFVQLQTQQDRHCTYNVKLGARSRNHCCRAKAISITYSEYVSVVLVIDMQSVCAVLYCHLWPVWLYYIFPHYLINGTIFGKKLLNIKCVFCIYLQLLSETFLILRRIQWDIINVHRSSCKVPVILVRFKWNRFSKNTEIRNFMKIRPVGAELFHAVRQTGMTKLITTFRIFAKAPTKKQVLDL
jgi:hypothetical protein